MYCFNLVAQGYWLINSNRSEVRRFIKNTNNKDRFFEYMFVDTGKIVGVLGKEPPVMQKREDYICPLFVRFCCGQIFPIKKRVWVTR